MPMNPRLLRPRASQQAPPCTYPASLLLHFDGNFTDSSENGLTVTPVGGAATSAADSKFGGASLYVDGLPFVTVDGSNGEFEFGTDDFTIEFWMRDGGAGGESTLVTTAYPADQHGVWVGIGNSGSLYWHAGNGSWLFVEETSSPSVRDQVWHHVAYVRNGGKLWLFLDGQQVATQSIGLAYSLTNTNDMLTIGGRPDQLFTGYIDDLRITKGLAVYDCAFIPPTAPLSACVTPVPTSREAGLLLHFDGNFTDSSPNALTLTVNGDAEISTTQSKFGGSSAYFTGDSSDYATTPSTAAMAFDGDFTIEAWTYWTGDGTEAFVPIASCTGATDQSGWLITSIGGAMHFLGSGGSGWDVIVSATGVMIPQNQWSHIAVVRSGSAVTLYIDGTAVASATSSIAIAAGDDFYLGHYPIYDGSTPLSFTGYIDELRIVSGLAVYTGPFTPPTAPLTAVATPVPVNASLVLNFDGNFTDESVNALTVTANGDAAISTSVKKFGSGSLALDGDGDRVIVADAEGLGSSDFTIECWLYLTAYPVGLACVLGYRPTGNDYGGTSFAVNSSGGLLMAGTSNAAGNGWQSPATDHAFGASLALDEWSHIAMVRSGSTVTLYVDGAPAPNTTTLSEGIFCGPDLAIGDGAVSGTGTGAASLAVSGYIDGLRITKAALYCDEFTPPTAPPTPTAVPPCGCSGGAAPPEVLGCTDPSADNYDPSATSDDGSCYYTIWGCTDSSATNYDSSANSDDGSCVYPNYGCTDPSATNYNPSADTDDGSCSYE